MTRKLPLSAYYKIKDPKHYYTAMHSDIQLLHENGRYTTCMTVIMCCFDALAAGKGEASAGKFTAFAEKYFPKLCAGLASVVRGKTGAQVLYDKFRNGLCHLRSTKSGFGLAEDHELCGKYTGEIEINGKKKFIAVNIQRLIKDFLVLLKHFEKGAP